MTRLNSNVKRAVRFIDCHPRVGWYVAAVTTLNLISSFSTSCASAR